MANEAYEGTDRISSFDSGDKFDNRGKEYTIDELTSLFYNLLSFVRSHGLTASLMLEQTLSNHFILPYCQPPGCDTSFLFGILISMSLPPITLSPRPPRPQQRP